MLNRDLIWECDYGNRNPVKNIIKLILAEQDADSLQMVQGFINNNPYALEFYVLFSYNDAKEVEINRLKELMKEIGMIQRPDINFSELLQETSKKRFNSMQFINPEQTEIFFDSMFLYKDREESAKNWPSIPLGKDMPVFISHSSNDKTLVENFIPYLTGSNIPIWYDKINIDYGESIVKEIQKGIKNSGVVIFWITTSFIKSNWCSTELESFLTRISAKNDLLILSLVDESVSNEDLPLIIQNKKYLRTNLQDREQLLFIANEIIPTIKKYYNN